MRQSAESLGVAVTERSRHRMGVLGSSRHGKSKQAERGFVRQVLESQAWRGGVRHDKAKQALQ